MTAGSRQLYFEGVRLGDELPPLVKPAVTRIQVAKYAGACDDYNPLYLDEVAAKAAGFPGVFAPQLMVLGFMAELAGTWVRNARLENLTSRFIKMVWPGDIITVKGHVVERRFDDDGSYKVGIDLRAENQRGDLVARGSAAYQLFYSSEDERRQVAGEPPLVVTEADEQNGRSKKGKKLGSKPPAGALPPSQAPKRPTAAMATAGRARLSTSKEKAAPKGKARPAGRVEHAGRAKSGRAKSGKLTRSQKGRRKK